MAVLVLSLLLSLGAAQTSRNIELQLTSLDSPVNDIVYCGKDNSVVLTTTDKNSVYRSDDSGITWTPLTESLKQASTGAIPDTQPSGKVDRIILSTADPSTLALQGPSGLVWFSGDCAKTFKAVNQGRVIKDVKLHPTVKTWALSASWEKCSDFQNSACKTNKTIYFTRNSGTDWVSLTDFVVQFSWAQDGLDADLRERIPKERVLFSRVRDEARAVKITGWSEAIDLLKTDDFMKTSEVVVPRGNKFIVADRYIMVAQVIEENSSDVQLLVSNERNIDRFYKAELPIKRIPDHSYTLLDSSEDSLMVNINHYGPQASYGNIYISDPTGRRFALSLLHNVRTVEGVSDVVKLQSLEGIYLANFYDKEFTTKELQSFKAVNKKVATNTNPPERSYIKSVITFDKGGEWKTLTPPEKDSEGKRVVCSDEECSLHLHLLTYERFAPAYSAESAVGLLLGTGNVGYSLSHSADEINTYLSRDGGLTWFEVRKGSNIYEIGDHGGLIVMADDQTPTDTLYYSWNEGLTWEALKFSSTKVKVDNILIKPGSTSLKFLLYGSTKSKGVVVSLDFSSLLEPQCRNPNSPGTDASDYELWSPNDGRSGSRCLMGRHVTYIRRKREAECYNGETYEAITETENCECTPSDYECDVGYYRDKAGSCVRVESYDLPPEVCVEDDVFYEILTGYRRVASNTCLGGVSSSFEPLRVHCSSSWSFSWTQVLTVLGVAVLGLFVYKNQDLIKEKLEGLRKGKDYSQEGFSNNLDLVPDGPEEDMYERQPEGLEDLKGEEFDPFS
jgi:hypothetical protein